MQAQGCTTVTLATHTPSATQSEGHGQSILVGTYGTGCHAARPWNKCFKVIAHVHSDIKTRKGRSQMGVFTARAEQRSQLRRWLAMAVMYEI